MVRLVCMVTLERIGQLSYCGPQKSSNIKLSIKKNFNRVYCVKYTLQELRTFNVISELFKSLENFDITDENIEWC